MYFWARKEVVVVVVEEEEEQEEQEEQEEEEQQEEEEEQEQEEEEASKLQVASKITVFLNVFQSSHSTPRVFYNRNRLGGAYW